MDPLTVLLVIVTAEVFFLTLAGVGAWVSGLKNREPQEGFWLGLLLGPLGVLVAAVLPSRPEPIRRP